MTVQIKLVPNLLTADPEDYLGMIANENRPRLLSDFENPLELFGLAITDGKLIPSAKSTLIEDIIREGDSLFTPLFTMRLGVGGNFKGEDDDFDPKRHEKIIRTTVGRQLQKKARSSSTKK